MTTNLMLNIFVDGYLLAHEDTGNNLNPHELRKRLLDLTHDEIMVDKVLFDYNLL